MERAVSRARIYRVAHHLAGHSLQPVALEIFDNISDVGVRDRARGELHSPQERLSGAINSGGAQHLIEGKRIG